MLKRLTIKNFKAIQDMTIEFTPLTVLIGGNGCGKSTVLQALDFLRSAAIRDIPVYLEMHKWTIAELKSKLNDGENKPIEFISSFVFSENVVDWYFIVDFTEDKWSVRELFCVNGKGVISYRTIPNIFGGMAIPEIPQPFVNITLSSSTLKVIDDYLEQMDFGKNEIYELQKYLKQSSFLDVLSPETIRGFSANQRITRIGYKGENLKSFIHSIDDTSKNELNKIISEIIGFQITVMTFSTGEGIAMELEIHHEKETIKIDSLHISDGLLRIIVFAAIKMERLILRYGKSDGGIQIKADGKYSHKGWTECECGFILIDEIENGVNPYITEKIITLLRDITNTQGRQIIFTTHSPVILNDINPDYINLLWKDKSGSVYCRKLFSISELYDSLDFLSPGDAWMNIREEDLLAKASSEPEDKK
ncbi:MAG: AAA family ATPase [Treponema sp.]|jgi:predicted ATPase|nr:AAA family ATPase [Treponema sp.]